MEIFILIGVLGLGAGFLSGLLGIGGGIIMAPLLLYIPPLFGFEAFPMGVVAGLTIIQGLAACLSGALTHRRFNFLSGRLTVWMGSTIFIAALLGGAGARHVANDILLALFGAIALAAAVLMLIPHKEDNEAPEIVTLIFSRWRAAFTAGSVGLLCGLVGQGGSFILIPLMTSFVRIPTRIAIGSNLAIVLLSTTAAFIGKAMTGQIVWHFALPIILSVIPATYVGSRVSRTTPVKVLRLILALLIGVAAVRIWLSVLFSR